MTSVVLFGAGASFGSGDVEPCLPPLGNGRDGLFARLEAAGGAAAALPEDLKQLFRQDFEQGMASYYELNDRDTMTFQRELATYLASFRPGPKNHYRRLIGALGVSSVVYSSLNYDLLLELAAGAAGIEEISYDAKPAGPGIRILKPHGSCNFWPDLNGNISRGDTFRGNGQADIEAPVRPLSLADTLRRCKSGDLAPAMALYAVGKAVRVSPSYVLQQQQQWRDAVARASSVFVIGVRVHVIDEHIWGPLQSTKAPVTYFGREPDRAAFLDWKALGKKNA